jgi:hypothetical protein
VPGRLVRISVLVAMAVLAYLTAAYLLGGVGDWGQRPDRGELRGLVFSEQAAGRDLGGDLEVEQECLALQATGVPGQ